MRSFAAAATALCLAALPVSALQAQAAPVLGVADPEPLFHDKDARLDRNKQAAYHIVKDLLEAGQWGQADKWLTERYIQHNPLAASGRAAVVDFFTKVMKVEPKPVPARMATKIVAVVAQGDYVIVVYPREMNAKDPAKAYSTTWFDMWRFVDGKADEHWDPSTKN